MKTYYRNATRNNATPYSVHVSRAKSAAESAILNVNLWVKLTMPLWSQNKQQTIFPLHSLAESST